MKTVVPVLLLCLAACSNTWHPQTRSTGWHACAADDVMGCPEWYVCVKNGCEYVGDPNGPGPADVVDIGVPAR